MMEFDDRLERAIQRGQRRNEARQQEDQARQLTEEEFKRLHSQSRLKVSEHIESCLKRLPNHFPGFTLETLFGDRGWGAACSRDDIRMVEGRRDNDYSRLEMSVRPFSSYHVLELTAKGTVRNKEIFNRNYFEKLDEVDLDKFLDLVDTWVLEYAELYAARH